MKVMKSLGAADSEFASCLTRWSNDIRTCYMQDAVDEIVTTRRLVNIATAYSIFGCRRKAVEMATARFDEATKESFISMYEKIDASIRRTRQTRHRVVDLTMTEDDTVLDIGDLRAEGCGQVRCDLERRSQDLAGDCSSTRRIRPCGTSTATVGDGGTF